MARLEAIKAQRGDLECRWEHLRPVAVVESRPMVRTVRTENGDPLVEYWEVVYLGGPAEVHRRREDQTAVKYVVPISSWNFDIWVATMAHAEEPLRRKEAARPRLLPGTG